MTAQDREILRLRFKAKLQKKKSKKQKAKLKSKYTAPRYDEVYFKGVEWLNSL